MVMAHALKNELNQTVGAVPVILIECFFTTGWRRFAMWQHNIVYNTVTYFGLGQIQEVEPPVADQGTVLTEQFLRFFVQNDPTSARRSSAEQPSRLLQWLSGLPGRRWPGGQRRGDPALASTDGPRPHLRRSRNLRRRHRAGVAVPPQQEQSAADVQSQYTVEARR